MFASETVTEKGYRIDDDVPSLELSRLNHCKRNLCGLGHAISTIGKSFLLSVVLARSSKSTENRSFVTKKSLYFLYSSTKASMSLTCRFGSRKSAMRSWLYVVVCSRPVLGAMSPA